MRIVLVCRVWTAYYFQAVALNGVQPSGELLYKTCKRPFYLKYSDVLHWRGRSSLVIHLVFVLGTCLWHHKAEFHDSWFGSTDMVKCKPRNLLLLADHSAFNVGLQKWWIGWRFLATKNQVYPSNTESGMCRAMCTLTLEIVPCAMSARIWRSATTTLLETDGRYSHWKLYQRVSLRLERLMQRVNRTCPFLPSMVLRK